MKLLDRLNEAKTFLSAKINDKIIGFEDDEIDGGAFIVIKDGGDKKIISNLFFATGLFTENDDVRFKVNNN
jgi:hypothetical protein